MNRFKSPSDLATWAGQVDSNIAGIQNMLGDVKRLVKHGKLAGSKSDYAQGGQILRALIMSDRGRLDELGCKPYLSDARAAAGKASLGTQLTSDATTGSYTVPEEFMREIQRAVAERSVMLPLVKKTPMSSYTKKVPTESTGATLTWVTSQGTALTETSPTFAQKTLTAYSLAAWISLNESLLEDEDVDLLGYWRDLFADDLANELDNQILNGTGTPWTGVLQDASVNTVTMGAGHSSFGDINYDDMLDLIEGLTELKYRRGAAFILNPTVADSLRQERDASGRFIWQESPLEGTPARIAGYPVYQCDAAPSSSAAETAFVAFGNWQRFLLGVRKELDVKVFDQTEHAVETEEILIRARCRYGGAVAIPAAFSILKTSA